MTTTEQDELEQIPPSLGGEVCDWMEGAGRYAGTGFADNRVPLGGLVHGPGDILGEPYRLTDEHRMFIWRAYELRGVRRRYRRAVYSRRKGTAKTEMSAAISAAELLGPVRFSHWELDEETGLVVPRGRPVSDPNIPMASTSEDQAEEALYGAARRMMSEGPLGEYVDVGLEKTFIRHTEGKLVLVTSSSVSREGGKPTFTPCDETHLWTTSQLKTLHGTLRRNLPKRQDAEPWMLETTTAFGPGEGSVAEGSAEYGEKVLAGEISDPTLLYDHLAAGMHHDVSTEEGLLAALEEASGLAWPFTDAEGIIADFRDPQSDEADSRRFWLNQVMASKNSWLDPVLWKERAVSTIEVRPRERITLGFHGSQSLTATALVACRLSDGHLFPLEVPGKPEDVSIWERPEKAAVWEVDRREVDATLHNAMGRYEVVRMYADPAMWQDEVGRWQLEFGERVLGWWTNRPTAMAKALERLHTAITTTSSRLTHSGSTALARHIAAARKDVTRSGTLIRPPIRGGNRHIAGATAATLAFEARADAIAAGLDKKPPKPASPVSADSDPQTMRSETADLSTLSF